MYHPIDKRKELVRREATLLPLLKDRTIFQIPELEFVNLGLDTPYMGYRRIPGSSLSWHFSKATQEQQQFLGEQVGHFLGELHKMEENDLGDESRSFTPAVYRQEQRDFFQHAQDRVFSQLGTRQKKWAESLFHDFLDDDENFEFEPVFVHGDFDLSNILVNPETYTITGIIDFEDLRNYDPAVDFIFLRESAAFLKAILQTYPHSIDQRLGDRVIYLLGKQPFFYILKGLDFGLGAMLKYGYERLAEYVEKWSYLLAIAKQSFS
jgi:aminoglycoside 2''-phosphotransferase